MKRSTINHIHAKFKSLTLAIGIKTGFESEAKYLIRSVVVSGSVKVGELTDYIEIRVN